MARQALPGLLDTHRGRVRHVPQAWDHRENLDAWLCELERGLEDARSLSGPFLGWQQLQATTPTGARRTLPSTEDAVAAFHMAHDMDSGDAWVAHHLAVAHHARAWDLELRGDEAASREWTEALWWWRRVQASNCLWEEMERHLDAVFPGENGAYLAELRSELYLHLLQVHVDFIKHYQETGERERAAMHLRIVRSSRIPPVVKEQLEPRLFAAMTVAVGAHLEAGEYRKAADAIEDFTALEPDFRDALELAVEVYLEWLQRVSAAEDPETLMELQQRAWAHATRLARLPDIAMAPLALDRLEDIALAVAARLRDYVEAVADRWSEEATGLPTDLRARLAGVCDRRVEWLALLHDGDLAGTRVSRALCFCTMDKAEMHLVAGNLGRSEAALAQTERLACTADVTELDERIADLRSSIARRRALGGPAT